MLRNGFAWEFSVFLAAAIFSNQKTRVFGDPQCFVLVGFGTLGFLNIAKVLSSLLSTFVPLSDHLC